MDPLTIIVSALVAGAAAGGKDVVATAVRESYAALRNLLLQHARSVAEAETVIDTLVTDPDADRAQLRAALAGIGLDEQTLTNDLAAADSNAMRLLVAAHDLIAAVREHESVRGGYGVNLEEVQAETAQIINVTSADNGVRISKSRFGTMNIEGVEAGTGEVSNPL